MVIGIILIMIGGGFLIYLGTIIQDKKYKPFITRIVIAGALCTTLVLKGASFL